MRGLLRLTTARNALFVTEPLLFKNIINVLSGLIKMDKCTRGAQFIHRPPKLEIFKNLSRKSARKSMAHPIKLLLQMSEKSFREK